MKRVISFGTREFEEKYFIDMGKKYNYEFTLESTFDSNDIINLSKGFEIIMIRGNCALSKETIQSLHSNGLKFILSRSVGYDHVSLNTCKELGINIFNVPSYSPNAISELALSLAMMLLRNTAYTVNKTSMKDYTIDRTMFSREIRNCRVGIIGCGKIGYTSATLFKGLGADVVVYDINKNYDLNYVSLEELISTSDIISLHMPYIKDVNHHFVNKEFLKNMKSDGILINTARGELVNTLDLVEALESNVINSAALDVIENEKELYFKKFNNFEQDIHSRMHNLYPKLLLTPHVGASTDEALRNMIEISIKNLEEYITTGKCINTLIK